MTFLLVVVTGAFAALFGTAILAYVVGYNISSTNIFNPAMFELTEPPDPSIANRWFDWWARLGVKHGKRR